MKTDITGRELAVGDHVVLTHFWKGSGLTFGRVTGEANGYMEISYPWARDLRDTSVYVLKVDREHYPAQFAAMDERIGTELQRREERRQEMERRRMGA